MREYAAEGVTPEQLATGERRRMDCMDCHNRPSHRDRRDAERAVNEAMAGQDPATLPFVHREAVKALKGAYPSQEAATERLPGRCGSSTGRSSRVSRRARRGIEQAVAGAQECFGATCFRR